MYDVKRKQRCPRFELASLCPFPTTINITPCVTLDIIQPCAENS